MSFYLQYSFRYRWLTFLQNVLTGFFLIYFLECHSTLQCPNILFSTVHILVSGKFQMKFIFLPGVMEVYVTVFSEVYQKCLVRFVFSL